MKKIKKKKFTACILRNGKGVTLIELMIALVIAGIVVAGIYRVFIAQSKAYTVQDQVVEVQQSIRSAMEIISRDLRMAGFDGNSTPSRILRGIFPGDYALIAADNAVRIEYRVEDKVHTKVLGVTAGGELVEDHYIDGVQQGSEVLLGNVNALTFSYAIDGRVGLDDTQNGNIDDLNDDGKITGLDFLPAATVDVGNLNVIAVRVALTASATPVNPDIPLMVQPRTLVSTITLRNLSLVKTE